jgi:hypothetical protein
LGNDGGAPNTERRPLAGFRAGAFGRRRSARRKAGRRRVGLAGLGILTGVGAIAGLLVASVANLIAPGPWIVGTVPAPDQGEPTAAPPTGDSIVFGTGADRPERTPDIFPTDAKEILCFYDFPDVPADAALACSWLQPGQQDLAIPPDAWHPDATSPCARGMLALRCPPDALLPEGIHEVELSDATGPVDRASFCVLRDAPKLLNAAAATPRETRILSAVVTDSATPDGGPGPPRKQFGPSGRIYVAFRYQGAENGMAFPVAWFAEGELIPQATQDVVVSAADGWGQAWIETAPTSPLPEGHYEVTVSLPGATGPTARAQFEIR